MKKQPENRKHNWTDADMYIIASQTLQLAIRDQNKFATYGINAQKLNNFGAQLKKFKGLPDDDELVGEQMLATEKKYDAREKLKSAIRSLMTRVTIKFNNKSGRYRKFGTAKIGDMTDAQLIFCGRRVVRVARNQIDWLADVGVNETVIKKIVDANQKFERIVNIQIDKVSNRDIAVETRVQHANKIYEEMVKLSEIGKDIWHELDHEKYEAYRLYESNNEYKKALKSKKVNTKS